MDHVMKDCLMVSRQHRLADVCRRLHTPKISNIVVCGSSGEVHGVIPLWHILQLLQGNRAFTDRMIASLTLEEIGSALDAALCFDAQHSRWKGMRIFAGEPGDDLSHMICMAEGDRQLLSQAVRSTPGCVIVCGASMISDTLLKEARERYVSLLRTEKHIHEACHALILSLPAERLMVRKVH